MLPFGKVMVADRFCHGREAVPSRYARGIAMLVELQQQQHRSPQKASAAPQHANRCDVQ